MQVFKEIIKDTLMYKIYKLVLIKKYFKNSKFSHNSLINLVDVKRGHIKIGENVNIGKNVEISGCVEIGDYSYISDGHSQLNAENSKIIIGRYCSIARNCFIRTTNHFISRISTSPKLYDLIGIEPNCITKGQVVIGNDVWIAVNVTILGNVSIGDGAIIAAGSVVDKDVPSYSIVGGIPAKIIKYRFNEEKIKKLKEFRYWNLEISELLKERGAFEKDY